MNVGARKDTLALGSAHSNGEAPTRSFAVGALSHPEWLWCHTIYYTVLFSFLMTPKLTVFFVCLFCGRVSFIFK